MRLLNRQNVFFFWFPLLFVFFFFLFCGCVLLGEQEEVFLYGEEISVDATEKEEEVSRFYVFTRRLSYLLGERVYNAGANLAPLSDADGFIELSGSKFSDFARRCEC